MNVTLGAGLVSRTSQLRAGGRELLYTTGEHVLLQAQQILTLNFCANTPEQVSSRAFLRF